VGRGGGSFGPLRLWEAPCGGEGGVGGRSMVLRLRSEVQLGTGRRLLPGQVPPAWRFSERVATSHHRGGGGSTSLADVLAHEHIAMLPTGYSLPLIHTALIDGTSTGALLRTPSPSMMMLLMLMQTPVTLPSRPCFTILALSTRPRTYTPRAPFQR
jgi:hypothetical protein